MKKILILGILLISILSISAVSAADNLTDSEQISDLSENANLDNCISDIKDDENTQDESGLDNNAPLKSESNDNDLLQDSFEPTVDSFYCIGPGSYVSFDTGKNTSGTAELMLYESLSDRMNILWDKTTKLTQINYTNGQGKIYLPSLGGGSYNFYLNIYDDTYGNWSEGLFAQVRATVSIPEEIYGTGEINFELYKANGTLFVYIDNEPYTIKHVENGKATISIAGLDYGQHYITLHYNGTNIEDIEFFENISSRPAEISPVYVDDPDPRYYNIAYYCCYRNYAANSMKMFYTGPISINADDVNLGNPAVIQIKARNSASNVVITILNNTYILNSSELNITLPDLDLGEYDITANFMENDTAHQFNRTFHVIAPGTFGELETIIRDNFNYNTLKLTNDYINNGFEKAMEFHNSVTVDGNGHTIDANNTSQIVKIYLKYTQPTIDVVFKNINFKNAKGDIGGAFHISCEDPIVSSVHLKLINCTFTQCRATYGGAISGYAGQIINSTFIQCSANKGGAIGSEDWGWNIINSTFIQCSAKQGGAIYLDGGRNRLTNCYFENNTADRYFNWYCSQDLTATNNIIKNRNAVTVSASNLKTVYTASPYYAIKVYDGNGEPADSIKVAVKVNGKAFKTLTSKKGIAKFKVSQTPGTYKLTITSQGKTVTKTLTVTHLVTLKNVAVKRSAKKPTLQATLAKVNGKYLKNKQITFKFNGKTYKAKTNSKGIAKVTIKKSVLSKLKTGKKITYQATYLKDTVKKTVKVKK